MIICIEGGDACGKATQSKIIAELIGARRFAFPDYTTLAGNAIIDNLKSVWAVHREAGAASQALSCTEDRHRNALVLQSLMLTNRMEKMAELIDAKISGHVVLDRYDASAIVYGALDGLDRAWLDLTNAALPVHPDVYILLDAPVEEGFRRRPERRDRYERDREYLERVRVEYLRLFAERQEARRSREAARWRVVNATGTVEQVTARIVDAIGVLL